MSVSPHTLELMCSCHIVSSPLFPQNQFGYRDGSGSTPEEGLASGASPACVSSPDPAGTQGAALDALEDQRCNGTLHKKKTQTRPGAEDNNGQRYSADPTVFLGDRGVGPRGDTDEDGYMTPMKDKTSSGR